MDHEILVDQKLEDGLALIAQLAADGFDVTVAFWAKLSDGGLWYLYIGTKSLESMPFADAWRAFFAAFNQVKPCSISISEIKLIRDTDPSAIEAKQNFFTTGTRYLKNSLGNLPVDNAYIYPKPTGTMSRASVVATAAHLMSQTGDLRASLIVLRDGTRMYAMPVSIRKTDSGDVEVVWRDVDASVDRTIFADDVAFIQTGRRLPTLIKVVR